jgi:hypothetical protein
MGTPVRARALDESVSSSDLPEDLGLDEPEGYEDAPGMSAEGQLPSTPLPMQPTPAQPLRLGGGQRLAEPAGYEDAPALHRHALGGVARAPQARAYGSPAVRAPGRGSGLPPARPTARPPAPIARPRLGGEHERYGNASAASAQDPPGYEDAPAMARSRRYGRAVARAAEGEPTAPAPAAARGRDDAYEDADDGVEPELPASAPGAPSALPARPPAVPLSIPEKFKIVALVAQAEGGPLPAGYAAINADGEYNDSQHPFYQQRHVGLSWGLVQFTQASGALGRVLAACKRRDAAAFAQTFGPAADELVDVTTSSTEADRLRPVGGKALWDPEWVERFRQAGAIDAFQAAQNEVAIEDYFDVNLPFARWLGFDTDRALALLYDRCVHMGNAAARSFVMQAVGPIRTQEQRSAALAAVGASSLAAFAAGVPELAGDARWTPLLHAALVAALRPLGAASPVALPALDQALDQLASAAASHRFADRVSALRQSPELHDVAYQLLG